MPISFGTFVTFVVLSCKLVLIGFTHDTTKDKLVIIKTILWTIWYLTYCRYLRWIFE
jgi:hypothetical protein